MITDKKVGHLVVRSLSLSYNHLTPNEIPALMGVSFELLPGEFGVVVGPNGSGKTSLQKVLSGRVPLPDEGSIILDGIEISGIPEHRRSKWISSVTQHPLDGTAPSMTVAENLALAELNVRAFGLRIGVTGRKRESYMELLSTINLEDRLDQPAATLSGGQRQMLTILMATFGPKKLLLLDEPISSLDPVYTTKCLGLIKTIVEEKHITTLMVTHNVKHALEYGNRLILLNRGKVLANLEGSERTRLNSQDIIEMMQPEKL